MRLALLLVFSFAFLCAFGQDPVGEKMSWYAKAKPSPNLFVHFDKNVYSDNETIWFTGYLIKNRPGVLKQQSLIVAIVRDIDSTLVAEDRFLLKNGFAYGNLLIPDSIITGDYHLIAFTNQVSDGSPVDIFSQPILIKTKIEPSINAKMELVDSGLAGNKVLISASRKDGKFPASPFAISYRYGHVDQQAQTDLSGNFLITLPHQDQLNDPNLYVKLRSLGAKKSERDSTIMNLPLPQPKGKANVKFYPEGGHSVSGLSSTIGFEIKDQQNKPVYTQAFLYKNNEVIDTVSTGSNGMGRFKLLPEADADYTVMLFHSGFLDSIYHLPKAIASGVTLSLEKSVVEDTLRVILKSNSHKKLIIRLHNLRSSFLYLPFQLENTAAKVAIPLTGMPKGILSIMISDSVGKPLAERLFFAHYDGTKKLDIVTDKTVYKQREKVTVNLNLDPKYKMAAVSIASVQGNRILLEKQTDIENYVYLNQELSNVPIHPQGNGLADRNYLEDILLIKGWRRYSWQELEDIEAVDTLQKSTRVTVQGIIRKGNKTPPVQIEVSTLGNQTPKVITSAANGTFELDPETLLTPPGKKMYVLVNDRTKLDYLITVNDPILLLINSTIKNMPREESELPSTVSNTSELVVKRDEKSISLSEVIVTANKDQSFDYAARIGMRRKNECGDYVCSYGILNCPNHVDDRDNVEPTPGQDYLIQPENDKKTMYTKCIFFKKEELKYFVPVTGIHLEKEFYENSYKDPLEPAFLSTIYWKHSTLLQADKTTTLSFFTSDITGPFKIIVQGLADNDVVYGEHSFEVKGK